jgi:hypothetical protein
MKLRELAGTLDVGTGRTLGAVTWFPVWSDSPSVSGHVTTSSGALVVSECETPTVARLSVSNPGTTPVLVLEGETLQGGQQDRVVVSSHLVGAEAVLELPVACVEAGRWSPSEHHLQRRGRATPTIRSRNARTAVQAERAGGPAIADQRGTWAEVERLRSFRDADAPTSSFHDVAATGPGDVDELGLPQPLEGQRGVVLGFGGRIRSLELFPNASDLTDHWRPVLRAALLEAEVEPPGGVRAGLARRFVRRVTALPCERMEVIGEGRRFSAGSEELLASGLTRDGALLHLTAFDLTLAV